MREILIGDLAYLLKEAKENNQPQPIFFLGAGASVSGGIPLASEIAGEILKEYGNNPFVKKLSEENRTYANLMEALLPFERNKLLKGYIESAKINVTHIYLAQLLNKGFVDYVLTVNFDNLMLRALALYNEFPSSYDMAILKDLTTTSFKNKSVVHLHGQHHGLWLLNTADEMEKVKVTVPRIFDSIKDQRPWIFIGYSGSDPIFNYVKRLGRFDNGLYWVTYNNSKPQSSVSDFLSAPHTNAFVVKGYDSDAFMLKLNDALGLPQPQILDKPFSCLKEMLGEIRDVRDEDHFRGVKERLEISKRNVQKAIKQFEEGGIEAISEEEMRVDTLKKEIIDLLISEKYDVNKISDLEIKAHQINDGGVNVLLSGLYSDWGVSLGNSAKTKGGKASEDLYQQAFCKFQKAIDIQPDSADVYNNQGTALLDLAGMKAGKASEELHLKAIDKFQKAIDLRPDFYVARYNLGNALVDLAKTKESQGDEALYYKAFEEYQGAIDIQPDFQEAYSNWATTLVDLAEIKGGQESEVLYDAAVEKYQKAIELGGEHYNFACLFAIRGHKKEAFDHLSISLRDKEISYDFVLKDEDWVSYLSDQGFKSVIRDFMN